MNFSILDVFVNPDDEVFGIGGTPARYAAEGGQAARVRRQNLDA